MAFTAALLKMAENSNHGLLPVVSNLLFKPLALGNKVKNILEGGGAKGEDLGCGAVLSVMLC